MNDELKAAIEEVLKKEEQPFAAFDFDGTCIENDVAETSLAYMCRNKLLRDESLLRGAGGNSTAYHQEIFQRYYKLLQTASLEAYLLAARIFADFTHSEAEELVSAAIAAEGEELGKTELYGISIAQGLRARPVVREIAQFLREKGVALWVVSASPEVAVHAAMHHFGYSGKLIGLHNEEVDGIMTKTIEEPYSIKEGKVTCIKKHIDPTKPPALAIGDTLNDLPMLEYARLPIVVDQGNALAALARERGWHLIPA